MITFSSFSDVVLGSRTTKTAHYSGAYQFRNAYQNYRVKAGGLSGFHDSYFPGVLGGSSGPPPNYGANNANYGGCIREATTNFSAVTWEIYTGALAAGANSTWTVGSLAASEEGLAARFATDQEFDEDLVDIHLDCPLTWSARFFVPIHYWTGSGDIISNADPTHAQWTRYPYIMDRHSRGTIANAEAPPYFSATGPVSDRACPLFSDTPDLYTAWPNRYIDSAGLFKVLRRGYAGSTRVAKIAISTFTSDWFVSAWGVPPVRVYGWAANNYTGTYPTMTKVVAKTDYVRLSAMRIDGSTYTVNTFGPYNWTEVSDTFNVSVQRTAYTYDQTFNETAPADAMFLRWEVLTSSIGHAGGEGLAIAWMPMVPAPPYTATSDHATGVRCPAAFIFRAP